MAWRHASDPHNPENRNAGNGGDLVKHSAYLALLRALLGLEPWSRRLRLFECHAGRGIYRDCAGRRRDTLVGAAGLLADAQRDALAALGVGDDWYAGSALLNARMLAAHGSQHAHQAWEWDPDTRRILSSVLDASRVTTEVVDDGERIEGESALARLLPELGPGDVVMLDPFGLWQRPKLAHRRARYRRIFEAFAAHAAPPALAMFFTWSHAEAADDDIDARGPAVGHGYRELAALVADRTGWLVRWSWDISCAMWLLVPRHACAPLHEQLRDAMQSLAVDVQLRPLGVAPPSGSGRS